MNAQTLLILLQAICFTATSCMALMLALSRVHLRHTNRHYEHTRWILFAAMLLYAVHYAVQMAFGFRAQGDDVGALVNILFYTPVAYLVSYATIGMASRRHHLRRYTMVGCTSMALILAATVAGWGVYHSLHMPWALGVMGVIFALTMLFYVFAPLKEIRHVRRQVENATGSDLELYHMYMNTGTSIVCGMAVLIPLAIFSFPVLCVVGPLFMAALFFYNLSFVVLGFQLPALSSVLDDSMQETPTSSLPAARGKENSPGGLTEDEARLIATRIETWRAHHGYSDANTNLLSLSRSLGVDKGLLTQYIMEHEGLTFRVWLSNLRIQEVKRMLLDHANYSNKAIAQECGFSSRSWMQEKFKADTGMTPNEWREARMQSR